VAVNFSTTINITVQEITIHKPVWWLMPVSSATVEVEPGGPKSKASPGEVSTRPYLKNKVKANRLEVWLR
jgi:hypothetical protein